MRPYILHGHTRALTCVKYNREGDLLFTCSKDNIPTVWFSENGDRLGTFDGHRGTVWWLDVSSDSKYLITGGADMTVKLWEVETGKLLVDIPHSGSVRYVEFTEGDNYFITVCDPFQRKPAGVAIYKVDVENTSPQPVHEWDTEQFLENGTRMSKATFTACNDHVLTGDENGVLRVHDMETGKMIREIKEHKKKINSLRWNKERTFFITGSADMTSKLFDGKDYSVLKTYTITTPVNSVCISPIREHVFVAGGQDAMSVTTTSSRQGKFETKLFHMVFGDEFGSIKGHFGPVNAIDVHPDGIGFTSGSEDGLIRVHQFDKDYFNFHSEFDDLDALKELAT